MNLTVKIPDEENSEFSGDEGEKDSSENSDIEHDKTTLWPLPHHPCFVPKVINYLFGICQCRVTNLFFGKVYK